MLKELYTAALGMQNQQTRLEVVANNMANSSTTGFKRDSVFERNLIDARAHFYNVPGDAEQNDSPIGSYTDFKQGAFQQTDNPLDLAIQDEGFFVLQDEEGKKFLSRAGHFTISKDGYIVAKDGKMLAGEDGPINVQNEFIANYGLIEDKRATNVRITDDGEVFVNNQSIARIAIAKVTELNVLEKATGSDFILTDDSFVEYIPSDKVIIKQGWIESSNVDIIGEMVEMIELQRHYEAGSKVIHTNDSTLDGAIKLGKYF